ncbi:25-hydroxyvitamin D-1 alpha hydroxylase, mitochondrial-like [Achlya hypogyna]|uniref:25-hydroxyvitamin D-1 alpha hydroxylase, mitochondrial-like n=1 Tax=Achlya hypogyna TaxID=1202772 RepID=A0A1V9YF50_ACHHY|nr:25-hydroxyvitamin D-1 alpha hydroxylase, mitochondrial-like [Achlya hypogyna]
MLCNRFKSTLAVLPAATARRLTLADIPVAPETGIWPLRSSYSYMMARGGFQQLFKHVHELHASLGPIFRMKFFPFAMEYVSVADPAAFEHVYRTEGEVPQRQVLPFWQLYRDSKRWPLGTGLANDLAEWKRYRASMGAYALSPRNIASWIPRIDNVAQDLTARIKRQATSADGVVPVTLDLKAYALEVTSSLVFGERMGCVTADPTTPVTPEALDYINAVRGFWSTTQKLMMCVPPKTPLFVYPFLQAYKEHAAHADFIFDMGLRFMRKKMHAKHAKDPDFLSMFLENPELSEREAIAQALDVLFAGVDTTATVLIWTCYCLATAPNGKQIQEKMRDEVVTAMNGKTSIDDDVLSKLSYVRAVVKETTRLYPTLNPNMRYLGEDVNLLGYDLPKGTAIVMATYTTSRNPKAFDNPDSFYPERWLDRSAKAADVRKHSAFSTLPFGFGARGCAGRRLAESEMYILLAHLLQNLEIQWPANEPHPKATLETLLVPDRPLSFKFKPWTA